MSSRSGIEEGRTGGSGVSLKLLRGLHFSFTGPTPSVRVKVTPRTRRSGSRTNVSFRLSGCLEPPFTRRRRLLSSPTVSGRSGPHPSEHGSPFSLDFSQRRTGPPGSENRGQTLVKEVTKYQSPLNIYLGWSRRVVSDRPWTRPHTIP